MTDAAWDLINRIATLVGVDGDGDLDDIESAVERIVRERNEAVPEVARLQLVVDDQARRLDSLTRDRAALRVRVSRYRGIIHDSQAHIVNPPRSLWDRIDVALGGDDG